MIDAEKARVSRYLDARTEEKVTAVMPGPSRENPGPCAKF
jgi:hypothetical protein